MARGAGRIGCNFALDRISADARIQIIFTHRNSRPSCAGPFESNRRLGGCVSCKPSTPADIRITPPDGVREKFRRIKRFKKLFITQRGWTLGVLNIVRRLNVRSSGREPALTFPNADVQAHERELAKLHPDNHHIRDKIRQQLQVLRGLGIASQPGRGEWTIKK